MGEEDQAFRVALDAWIAERARDYGETISEGEAVRKLAAEALIGMGLLEPPHG